MKKHRTEISDGPVPASAKLVVPVQAGENSPAARRRNPLERWRRLASGLRGVRLFHVTLAASGKYFWETECVLNGRLVCRRFASELHARAWLSVATQPLAATSSVERDELDRPCSASCFATGG